LRKVLLVLGCLLFSSQASAKDFDCGKIRQKALNRINGSELFRNYAEDANKKENYGRAKELFSDAKEFVEEASHYATIYIAFCKD